MVLTRRQFLKWAGVTGVGAVVFNGCRVPDHEIEVQSPVGMPEDLVTGRDNYYATVAQAGSASEGLLVRVMEGRAKKIEGNPDYPMNTGKHGSRTEALLQAAYHPDRIDTPLVRIAKGGPFRPTTWPDALSRLAALLQDAEPASVLLATTPVRGRLADVVTAFASGYGARLMAFDPLEHTVVRAAVKHLYGQDVLPDFDIANAGYVMGFGADFLGTWLDSTHFMRGYGEFRQGHGERGRLVHVDSRFSLTAAAADQWVPVAPGSEGLLAMAMIHTIISEGLGDAAAANALTGDRGASALSSFQASAVAPEVSTPGHAISAEQIQEMARAFASPGHGQSLAIGGGSAAAHTNGMFNMTAVYALNALVGAVNRPGGMILNPPERVSQLLPSPLRSWKTALETMRAGDTQVLLVRDVDLVHGLPGELNPTETLRQVGTIVSFSSFLDDTTALADMVLPGHTPLEEWGTDTPDPGPGYSTVAFQQPVINRFRNTVSFGDVLLQTGRALGLEQELPWDTMRDAVRATAQDLFASGRGSIPRETYRTFEEYWKRTLERGGWWDMNSTVSSSLSPLPTLPTTPERAEIAGDPSDYPLYLVPYEAHSLGSGQLAHLPWVQATPDPITSVTWATWLDVNPKTALRLNLKQDDVVIVESATGAAIRVPVYVNPGTPPDVVSIPFGQGHTQFTTYAANRGSNVIDIIAPAEDAETGAYAWAASRVRLTKTNKRQGLPKLEGLEEARQLPHEPVLEVQRLQTNHA